MMTLETKREDCIEDVCALLVDAMPSDWVRKLDAARKAERNAQRRPANDN